MGDIDSKTHFETSREITRKLRFGVFLYLIIIATQVVGGFFANSLALLSDAAHSFTDLGALLLSLYAVSQGLKPPSQRKTFGYHRSGVLAALANSAALIILTIAIFWEAYKRVLDPQPVIGSLTLLVASVGFVANIAIAAILYSSAKENINVRSSFLHVFGDALVSLGVMLAAIIIIFTEFYIVDPLISFVIGAVIAYSAWKIIDESIHILLEGTPHNISVDEVLKALLDIKNVKDVHDLHIWTIGSNINALSCHILVKDMKISDSTALLDDINAVLLHDFGIGHTSIQFESNFCEANYLYCDIVSHRLIPKQLNEKYPK